MGLELRMKKLLGSGDDDLPAAMAEAESRGAGTLSFRLLRPPAPP
jgi:hypothetical protein